MSAAAVHQILVSLCLSKLGCHESLFHINNNSDAFHELSEALELSRVWLFSYKQCMLTKRKKPILSDLPQHINFFKRWLPWEFNSFSLCHLSPWMMTTYHISDFSKKIESTQKLNCAQNLLFKKALNCDVCISLSCWQPLSSFTFVNNQVSKLSKIASNSSTKDEAAHQT